MRTTPGLINSQCDTINHTTSNKHCTHVAKHPHNCWSQPDNYTAARQPLPSPDTDNLKAIRPTWASPRSSCTKYTWRTDRTSELRHRLGLIQNFVIPFSKPDEATTGNAMCDCLRIEVGEQKWNSSETRTEWKILYLSFISHQMSVGYRLYHVLMQYETWCTALSEIQTGHLLSNGCDDSVYRTFVLFVTRRRITTDWSDRLTTAQHRDIKLTSWCSALRDWDGHIFRVKLSLKLQVAHCSEKLVRGHQTRRWHDPDYHQTNIITRFSAICT